MSKYKVGDKFIVEIAGTSPSFDVNDNANVLYRAKGFNTLVFDDNGLDKLQKINPKLKIEDIDDMLAEHDLKKKAYEKGLADAWELARKIALSTDMVETARIFIASNICGIEQKKLFEDVFALTPQEALAKLEAYEESKVIKVGDEIAVVGNAIKGYVIEKSQECEDFYVVLITNYKDFRTAIYNKTVIEKTGRHIDIEHILEQIRGNE